MPSLVRQVSTRLTAAFTAGKGRSKHSDKIMDSTGTKIYTDSTLKAYEKHCCYFVRYAQTAYKAEHGGRGCKTLADARPYADAWLTRDPGLSASTLHLERSALCKLYGDSAADYVTLPSRRRSDITRSRATTKTDAHFSERTHADIVVFAKGTGLRRAELARIRGSALCYRAGRPFLHVTEGTKGGRERYSPIIGPHTDQIVALCRQAGTERVWGRVPSDMDVHGYRAQYASDLYQQHARPLDELTHAERYFCRGDRRGHVYDRRAMMIASHALGHNRLDVVAGHYLWQLDDDDD